MWVTTFIAAAIAAIDRLVHHAIILEFNVPSYRTQDARKRTEGERAKPDDNHPTTTPDKDPA